MGNKTSPSNSGVVVSVRGSVVDIGFDAHLPPIYSLLHAQEGKIAMEIWQGKEANVKAAQQALLHRAKCNQAARLGEYTAAMERT